MFGLTKLLHIVDPETTYDKAIFLFKNAFINFHPPTTIISFSALFSLVALRSIKNRFKNTWWIYRLPEVLVVVILSTSTSIFQKFTYIIHLTCIYLVLSDAFRWDEDGVDILGAVDVQNSSSFIEIPFRRSNFRFLRRTTSTAVYASCVNIDYCNVLILSQCNCSRWILGQHSGSQTERSKIRVLY